MMNISERLSSKEVRDSVSKSFVRPTEVMLSFTKTTAVNLAQYAFQLATIFALLPLDTFILLTVWLWSWLPIADSKLQHQRKARLNDARFYPKTILITGVDTIRGLNLARQFHHAGHRVVGADIGGSPVRSGGSVSNALNTFYRISKRQYIPNVIDIIHREKIDLWIPCSDHTSSFEDAIAKEKVESRTVCKCIQFDSDFAALFHSTEIFLDYISDRGLPIAENHQVKSRDSVHKILHRSPGKTFEMKKTRASGGAEGRDVLLLPRRTPSQTYSDVSQIAISQDSPWILKQHVRVGEYWADILLIHGQLKAFRVRHVYVDIIPSRLDSGLYMAMHSLMNQFAERGGFRLTGHLSVKLMVDEETSPHSVRYVLYIADCRQGTKAVSGLLRNPPPELYKRYLDILMNDVNGFDEGSAHFTPPTTPKLMQGAIENAPRPPVSQMVDAILKEFWQLRQPSPITSVIAAQMKHLVIWRNTRFSRVDPLPWWWNAHISQPCDILFSLFDRSPNVTVEKKTS